MTDPYRAMKLANASHYTIRRVRRIVDGDCDGVTWGDMFEISYDPDRSGGTPVADFESIAAACQWIEACDKALVTVDGFGPSGHSMRTRGPYPARGAWGMQRIA